MSNLATLRPTPKTHHHSPLLVTLCPDPSTCRSALGVAFSHPKRKTQECKKQRTSQEETPCNLHQGALPRQDIMGKTHLKSRKTYPGLGSRVAGRINPDIFRDDATLLIKVHVLHELLGTSSLANFAPSCLRKMLCGYKACKRGRRSRRPGCVAAAEREQLTVSVLDVSACRIRLLVTTLSQISGPRAKR